MTQSDSPEFINSAPKVEPEIENPLAQIRRQLESMKVNLSLIISPGSKRFKDLSKRVRLMFVAFGIPAIYMIIRLILLEQTIQPIIWIIISAGLALISYIGVMWGLKFQIRKESYYSVLNIPAVFTFSTTLFLSILFFTPLNRVYLVTTFIIAIAIFMVLFYIIMLAVNVLNVNLFYVIPLSKLGESLLYLSSSITAFILSFSIGWVVLYSIKLSDWFQVIAMIFAGIIVFIALYVSTIYYYLPLTRSGFIVAFLLGIMMLFATLALSILLPYIFVAAFLVSLGIYVTLGIIIHKAQNTLKGNIYAEYLIILLIIIAIIGIV